ncbi:hypothetical protein KBB68_01135 [Candidatus Babeliales bacterium]|nr:hypothetical protein [Candidatus Babeliales bacterium]
MKRLFSILTIFFLYNITHSEIFNFWNDLNHQTTVQLSELQNFQLAYLHDELAKNYVMVQTVWILNPDVRTLLEIMELSVQQSSVETQNIFKKKIIKTFQNFHIDVYFTKTGLIEKIDSENKKFAQHHFLSKKLTFHHSKNYKSNNIRPPQKIKGANRTRKKLEEAWKKRKESAKNESLKAQEKRTALQKLHEPTPADHMAEIIWNHEMQRHTKTLLTQKDELQTENNEFHSEA